MTEAEKTKIREAIKNDVKLSQAYKQLIKMKQRGRLRKEINPDEVMVSLVAKYGLNAAGLVDAALSRPADVMDKCKQDYSAASGTLKYLINGKTTYKQIADILGKTEAEVRKDKAIQGTKLPATRTAVRKTQNETKVTTRIDARQVDGVTGAAVKARQPQTQTQTQTKKTPPAKKPTTTKTTTKKTPTTTKTTTKTAPKTDGKVTFENNPKTYESGFDKKMKAQAAAQKREQEVQDLYKACLPSMQISGPVDLKTLMDKGLVTQKDIQAYYNKHSKDFVAGISAGPKGKSLAKSAYNHAKGHRCVGGCLSGVQDVNPDVPWKDDPAWDEYRRPGQGDENWGCDTYKVLEKKGYTTVTIENHSTGRESANATRLRRTIQSFPEGTTVSFDNQIDAQVKKREDYYGVIKHQNHPSKRCGHVATITDKGLCSDGFQPHENGYDPTNYGRNVHLSLADDTSISEDLAKNLIAEAYARREREVESQKRAKQYVIRE